MTELGQVVVRRKGYSAKGAKTLFPLDAELNLPQDKYSSELSRLVAQQMADSSFEEGVESTRRTTGGKVPKRQIIEQTAKISQDFDAFYKLPGEPEKTSDLLVISVDGKGIVMRQEDPRPATRKAAEQQKGSHGARLAPVEKLNRKRMATVAAVYSLQAQKRTPEQIMGPKENKPAPVRARSKRVWASIEHDSRSVIEAAFEEALKRDPRQSRHWVLVVDGGEQQLHNILDMVETYQFKITLGQPITEIFKQLFCFFLDGTSRHLVYFDKLKKDAGYVAAIETTGDAMLSSYSVKRFFTGFPWFRIRLFCGLLQQLFLWRLKLARPKMVELGVDTMVMDNEEAKKRHGVQPTYKKKAGFQPLQMTWGRFLIDAVFRGGKKHSNYGDTVQQMVKRIIQKIRVWYREDVPIVIRMDAGFFDQKLFALFEELGIGYICTGKLYKDIQEHVRAAERKHWYRFQKGKHARDYLELGDRRESWKRFRRAVYCRPMDKDGQLLLEFVRAETVIGAALTSWTFPSVIVKNAGILPRRSSIACSLIAPLVLRNFAQGNKDSIRSMTEASNA